MDIDIDNNVVLISIFNDLNEYVSRINIEKNQTQEQADPDDEQEELTLYQHLDEHGHNYLSWMFLVGVLEHNDYDEQSAVQQALMQRNIGISLDLSRNLIVHKWDPDDVFETINVTDLTDEVTRSAFAAILVSSCGDELDNINLLGDVVEDDKPDETIELRRAFGYPTTLVQLCQVVLPKDIYDSLAKKYNLETLGLKSGNLTQWGRKVTHAFHDVLGHLVDHVLRYGKAGIESSKKLLSALLKGYSHTDWFRAKYNEEIIDASSIGGASGLNDPNNLSHMDARLRPLERAWRHNMAINDKGQALTILSIALEYGYSQQQLADYFSCGIEINVGDRVLCKAYKDASTKMKVPEQYGTVKSIHLGEDFLHVSIY
jgi:hypothetical protein